MTIIAMQHQGFFLMLSTDSVGGFYLTGLTEGGAGFARAFSNFDDAYKEWIGVSELLVEGE